MAVLAVLATIGGALGFFKELHRFSISLFKTASEPNFLSRDYFRYHGAVEVPIAISALSLPADEIGPYVGGLRGELADLLEKQNPLKGQNFVSAPLLDEMNTTPGFGFSHEILRLKLDRKEKFTHWETLDCSTALTYIYQVKQRPDLATEIDGLTSEPSPHCQKLDKEVGYLVVNIKNTSQPPVTLKNVVFNYLDFGMGDISANEFRSFEAGAAFPKNLIEKGKSGSKITESLEHGDSRSFLVAVYDQSTDKFEGRLLSRVNPLISVEYKANGTKGRFDITGPAREKAARVDLPWGWHGQ